MELFYPNDSKLNLMDNAGACYLLYFHNVNGGSQTRYLFRCGSTMIS